MSIQKSELLRVLKAARIQQDSANEKKFLKQADVKTYTLAKLDAASEGASASYQLQENGTGIGAVIDIPKDMVVSAGEVKTFDVAGDYGAAGTYIVLTIANKAKDKLYIPVDSLIEYVTSGSTADDAVVVDVSADHKVTASLTDGKVTLAKLEADVQTKIGYIGDKAVSTQISDALTAAQETVTDEEIVGIFAD